jgi:hypothetical protein
MESMSWSDDTRCLYCEGRLPLYRKITHGQFCSSAHRKAYWQEHERLAVERLHQTHSSLRSYHSASHPDIQTAAFQEVAPYPELEAVTRVRVVTDPELDTDLGLDPATSFDVNLYPIPDMGEPPMPASELLGLLAPEFLASGDSFPELVAADPFEYEITRQPLPPSHSIALGTRPLPEGLPVAAWSYVGPGPSKSKEAAGSGGLERDYAVEVRHPESQEPSAGIRAAGRVGVPITVAFEAQQAAPTSGSPLQVLEMEPKPVTAVELEVPLQSDVLLELLDQQVPHPDRLQALGQFAARPAVFAVACPPTQHFGAAPETAMPAGAAASFAADYQLVSAARMLRLSGDLPPAPGTVASRTAICHIPLVLSVNPQVWMSPAGMATRQASSNEMGVAGLQTLASNSLRPAQGMFAQVKHSLAFDLSAGVSSDVTYPELAAVAASAETPLFAHILPLTFAKKRKAAGNVVPVEPVSRVLPQALETRPMFPSSGLEPLDRKPPEDALREPQSAIGSLMRGEGLRKLEPVWAHATGFWHHAPRDLKLLLFAIPALLALVSHPGWPRVAFAAPQPASGFTGGFKRVLNTEWVSVRQTLENRAAVALDEDFRSGLDNWVSPGGSTTEWSFDATGFVRPGPLALYRPSVNLTDYQMQFLGLIDKKALSWVVRAADFENFYVVKLEVVKPGPISALSVTRYAVINGKSQDRHDTNIPLPVGPDTLYRVRMDVQGSDFALEVQGQIADSWTETRLPRGGIGFFTASGEASRLRWMQITHQYDMLGRLCAYLAPYDTTNGSWQP